MMSCPTIAVAVYFEHQADISQKMTRAGYPTPRTAYLFRRQSLDDSDGDLLDDDLLHLSLQLRWRRWDSGRNSRDGRGYSRYGGRHGGLPLELGTAVAVVLRRLMRRRRWRDSVADGAGSGSNANRDVARTNWHWCEVGEDF